MQDIAVFKKAAVRDCESVDEDCVMTQLGREESYVEYLQHACVGLLVDL